MNESRKKRIAALEKCNNDMLEIFELYEEGSPEYILMRAAWENVNTLFFLENEPKFKEEQLGPKY